MLNPNDYDLSRSQWEHLIDEYIFSERDRAIVKRKMLDDVTFERLAEEYELSVQRTKAIVGEAKTRLLQYLN
jgi:DNA-directed RNA polymerase sigma subunit (sigma70/sigma32)